MYKNLLASSILILLAGCAHHRDVRPGADGIHRVIIQTEGSEREKQNALSQADHFCKEQNKYAAIVEEKQNYTGNMDEKTYQDAKTATKVLKAVGGAGFVFGGKKEKQAGGIGVLAGQAADSVLGEAYTVEMKFKCVSP